MPKTPIRCPECKHSCSPLEHEKDGLIHCPSCEHSFSRNDNSSIEKREKFYPGEKKGIDLSKFSDNATTRPSAPAQKANNNFSNIDTLEPINAAPLRFFALVLALIIFSIGYYIIIAGHQPNGIIFTLSNKKRLILALLFSIFGSTCFFYSSKKRRPLALLVALLLSAGLCYLPYHFKDAYKKERYLTLIPSSVQPKDSPKTSSNAKLEAEKLKQEQFLRNIHFPKFQSLKNSSPELVTTGLLIQQLPQIYQNDLLDYIKESLPQCSLVEANTTLTWIDDKPSSLIILQHPSDGSEQVFKTLKNLSQDITLNKNLGLHFGHLNSILISPVKQVQPENDVVNQFEQVTLDLLHLNRNRQEAALLQVKEAKRLIYAPEIFTSLTALMTVRDNAFKVDTLKALHNWVQLTKIHTGAPLKLDDYIQAAHNNVIEQAQLIIDRKQEVPISYLNYFAQHKVKSSSSILYQSWVNNPIITEKLYLTAGPIAKSPLEEHFFSLQGTKLKSACNILKVIGDQKTLDILQSRLETTTDKKNIQTLTTTIDAIKKRL